MEKSIFQWQEELKKASLTSIALSIILLYTLIFILSFFISFILIEKNYLFFTFFISISLFFILVLPSYYSAYQHPENVIKTIFKAKKAQGRNKLEKRALEFVEKMKLAFGYKNVETYIIPWNIINAMTVSTKEKSYIFITQGSLEKLNDEELEAVLAHEFSHIVNKDSYYMTLGVIVAGLTVIISYYLLRVLPNLFGSRNERRGNVTLIIILYIIGLLLALIAPFIQRRLVSKFSKKREFLADANAALVTKYPPGIINALIKVAKESTKEELKKMKIPNSVGLMFFDFESIETHPPIWQRVEYIAKTTKTPINENLIDELKKLDKKVFGKI